LFDKRTLFNGFPLMHPPDCPAARFQAGRDKARRLMNNISSGRGNVQIFAKKFYFFCFFLFGITKLRFLEEKPGITRIERMTLMGYEGKS
jgi:hypothetical protein